MTEVASGKQYVVTSFGRIAYLESGQASRPPVLLIHGIPTSGYLWRHVLRMLGSDLHCYAPDLMGLGDTEVDLSGRFDMDAQAQMLVELMSRLGHDRFAVVCHDQGGAAAQIIAATTPDRVGCLVLTDCVCYDNWPVPAVRFLQRLAALPGLAESLAAAGLFHLREARSPWSALRRGVYDRRNMTDEAVEEYLRPLRSNAASRRRFLAFLRAGHSRYSLAAVPGLRAFDKPTQVVWAADDAYLSPSWGLKLCEEIAGCRQFELVPFCGHFWQEERPAEFVAHIAPFLLAHAS